MSVEGTYELLFPFSQFEVERILGKLPSGRAMSWLSRSKESGELFVIKEVSLADSLGHEAWIDREWNGWARIREIRKGSASAIYIREYVEGSPLPHPPGPGDVSAALSLVAAICATLAPLHTTGAAHGRIKPANVILPSDGQSDGQIVLTDPTFDPERAASQPVDDGTAEASVAFDPLYISPEQVRGEVATPASDIYSLGCILFEQLTGKTPFRDPVPVMVCYKHVMSPPPELAAFGVHLPQDTHDLLRRMMAKSRRHRPQSAMEMLDLLEPLLDPDYSPAAMTGTFTFPPELLKEAQKQEKQKAEAPPPPDTEIDAEATQVLPVPRESKAVRRESASGTMIISRRELKRLIEKADNKEYPSGETPVLDPDERLPIPLVQAAAASKRPSGSAETVASSKAMGKPATVEAEEATGVMSSIQEREAAGAPKPTPPPKSPAPAPETSGKAPQRNMVVPLLMAYSIGVTLLLIAAIGVIVSLIL